MGDSHWTVDKRVPIALIGSLIGAIFIQTIGAVWWASAVSTRLDSTTARVEILEKALAVTQQQQISVAHLEEKVNNLTETVKEIRTVVVNIQSDSQVRRQRGP